MKVPTPKSKILSIVKYFLKENGAKSTQDIFNFVKRYKPNLKYETISSTLSTSTEELFHPTRGLWDLKENPLSERKDKLIFKLMKINYYSQKKLKDHNINGDSRYCGESINDDDEYIMEKIYKKFKEKGDKNGI
ncbi:MAG: hypothetical protein ACFFG0_07875 [Candidatus Thorarchaeota archaeon]